MFDQMLITYVVQKALTAIIKFPYFRFLIFQLELLLIIVGPYYRIISGLNFQLFLVYHKNAKLLAITMVN